MNGFQSYPHGASLQTLCDRFTDLQLKVLDLDNDSSAIDDDAFEAAAAPVWAEQDGLVESICATAARTDAEIRAKRVVLAVYRNELPPGQSDRWENALTCSIAADGQTQRRASV